MDIASRLPFCIQLRNRYQSQNIMEADRFFLSEEDAWNSERSSLVIEENDEIEVVFDSEDKLARLYTDAFYGIPANEGLAVDEAGAWYARPSKEFFWLYKSDDRYAPLCVDIFLLTIICEGKAYYGTLEVRPKQMVFGEWAQMRKELEEEVKGLSKNLVRRNQAFGEQSVKSITTPPELLSKFLIMKKYAKPVTAALMDIAEKPKSQIVTSYEMVPTDRIRVFARETARAYVRAGGARQSCRVPTKTVTYDIPGNRMLKTMLISCEKVLDEFISWTDEQEVKQAADKLRQISRILKQKPWYDEVSRMEGSITPHSFVMDARYNMVYQLYDELRRNEMHIAAMPKYTYVWKRSSQLYEIWCFIKVCQLLGMEYTMEEDAWEQVFAEKNGCKVLKPETIVRFFSKDVELHVQYDKALPSEMQWTDVENPLYMVRMQNGGVAHDRPDITIQMYSRAHGCYMGSIVVECKYRKFYSFWRMDSERSSVGQVQTYFNNARSEYLYGGLGKRFNCNPVQQILVLTPDAQGNGVEYEEFNVLIKALKPSKDGEGYDELRQTLQANIEHALENCEMLLGERTLCL